MTFLDVSEGYPSGQRGRAVNPLVPPTKVRNLLPPPFFILGSSERGSSSVVERQPSKLRVAGSSPVSRLCCFFGAHVAQSVEHFLGKEEVTGSNPVMGLYRKGLN